MYKCCFLACFCTSQRVQRRKAELTLAQIRKSYQTAGPIGTKFGTHICKCHKFKSLGKLSNGCTDWHQIWYTSGDSSGNGHRLNTIRPTIPQGHFGFLGGSQTQMFGDAVKRLDRLAPNLIQICTFVWEWT